MDNLTRLNFDVAVIGGGPAGIAAATVAAESGAATVLLDDSPAMGGQIWRSDLLAQHDVGRAQWMNRLRNSQVKRIPGAQVFHLDAKTIAAETGDAVFQVEYRRLILATGAREFFLPFPGWTLPNVVGAGGLQALIKSGFPITGKRVVIAGTGPLLMTVADFVRARGGNVLCVCEQTSWRKLALFALQLSVVPGKIQEASRLRRGIRRIPLWTNSWPLAAIGKDRVDTVKLSRGGRVFEVECDYLACGFHLVPNAELAAFMGCQLRDGFVEVDEYQRTTIRNVFCAGEPTGIGGVELALAEGQIAGYSASGQEGSSRQLFRQRAVHRRVVKPLRRAFQLRAELKALAQPETFVCRCEDVPLKSLREHNSWRAAKLHTRCGMGPCQGRVCGTAADFLFGWNMDSTRPPLFPVRCSSLAAISEDAALP
jgi:NADPH-dependent 2,4-dienoyl-CoA reductase/sulfur reductase-like enzyme